MSIYNLRPIVPTPRHRKYGKFYPSGGNSNSDWCSESEESDNGSAFFDHDEFDPDAEDVAVLDEEDGDSDYVPETERKRRLLRTPRSSKPELRSSTRRRGGVVVASSASLCSEPSERAREFSDLLSPGKRRKLAVSNALLPEPPIPVTCLADLVALAKMAQKTEYMDCRNLGKLLEPLQEIQRLIGLDNIKDFVTQQVKIGLQDLYFNRMEMNHIILYGPPGCGKTTIARLMSKLFARLGSTATDKFVEGNLCNMIGQYMGQTAPQTNEIVNKSRGGVLFIDEAYSLGGGGENSSTDSYATQCIDTLTRLLSEHGKEFVCILAGYKHEIETYFLRKNPGLSRRFPHKLEIVSYSSRELMLIFKKMASDEGMACQGDISEDFFKRHMERFPHFAGSVREFLDKVKLIHAATVFGKPDKCTIQLSDLQRTVESF